MPLLKRVLWEERKCFKSSTCPDSRHQNWPSMGMFLLRKKISHLCDSLQERLRGMFQCSTHRLQLLDHSLNVVLLGSPMCSHMAKRPFKVKRLNIVVTKDMAEVILVLPLDGSLSEERGNVTCVIALVTYMDKGLCTARSGEVRLSKGWFYLGSWEQLTHQLSPSAASYKMNCDFFNCYSGKMQLIIQKISKAID